MQGSPLVDQVGRPAKHAAERWLATESLVARTAATERTAKFARLAAACAEPSKAGAKTPLLNRTS